MGKARILPQEEVGVTLDTGALIALERGDVRMISLLEVAVQHGFRIRIPAGVAGQAWRGGGRQAVLARLFAMSQVDVPALDLPMARACGEVCGHTSTADVVDASVVVVARMHGDAIVTSDVEDLRRLDPSARLERI